MNRNAEIFLSRFLVIGKLQATNVEKTELLMSIPADSLPCQIGLKVKEETSEVLILVEDIALCLKYINTIKLNVYSL